MPDRGSLLIRLALSAVAALAVAPAAASAALTSSSVESPADGTFVRYDDTSGPTTFHVTGTASPPGSTVRLVCTYGTSSYATVGAAGEDIATDATTGHFEVDATPPVGHVCRLRATEAGQAPPPDLSPFTGPKIAVSGLTSFSVDTGANSGVASDYRLDSLLFSAGDAFDSIGGCGLQGSYLLDSALAALRVFGCSAWTPATGRRGDAALEVDGHPSFGPDVVDEGRFVYFPAFVDRQPYPTLGYSYHIDPATHDLTIHETDHFVRCKPNADAFPPTATSCTAFADDPVKLDRTILADHGQHVVRFVDRWSSTDGRRHLFTIQYQNEACLGPSPCSSNIGFRLPGQGTYTVRPNGTTSQGPFPAPGSIFVKDTTAPDGDASRGQGATVYSLPPDDVYFFQHSAGSTSGYVLDYVDRFVPAKGSLDFRFGYATALTTAAVSGFARQLADKYAAPRVTIRSPINGDDTANPAAIVKGTATDNIGVTSFKVNGRPVTREPGGKFSTRVKLKAGRNILTAVATDAAGNVGRAQATVVELLARTRKATTTRQGEAVVVDDGEALVCPGGSPGCTTTLSGTSTPGKVGDATIKTAAGKRGELTFKLNAKGQQALAAQGHLKITLKIDIRIGPVRHITTTRSFDVQRPAR